MKMNENLYNSELKADYGFTPKCLVEAKRKSRYRGIWEPPTRAKFSRWSQYLPKRGGL